MLWPAVAVAQFGGFPFPVPTNRSQAQAVTDSGCATSKKKKGSVVFGKIAGMAAGRALRNTGFARFVPVSEFASTITMGLACRLDSGEQKQAAIATDDALRSAKVGSTKSWASESRENVTGTSTVLAVAPPPEGQAKTKCMMVSDVIIVDGEETRVEKKMCKGPGQPRYAIATA